MDLSRDTAVSPSRAEGAAGAAGMVLLTLASAQFLMTLGKTFPSVNG